MDAEVLRKIEAAFDSKPGELQHLYVDTAGTVRDRYIEEMFSILFHGEDIDEEVFQNNFDIYFDALAVRLLPRSMKPGPEIFKDEGLARAWVTYNFGLLYVGAIKPDDPTADNETFAHCRYEARLRSRVAGNVPHYCYAPTAIHATLLTVVNLYRELASEYHQELIARQA